MNTPRALSDSARIIEPVSCIDLLALRRLNRERYPFLLQSTAGNETLGRCDILFACPGKVVVSDDVHDNVGGDFLTALDELWQQERCEQIESHLAFHGGWFVYLGYELAAEVEPSLTLARDSALPRAFAVRCPAAVVRNKLSGECFLIAEQQEAGASILADIERCRDSACGEVEASLTVSRIDEEPDDQFLAAVETAKEHIAAGDIYQANLSRSWSASCDRAIDAERVYTRLSRQNPAPFAGLAAWHDTSIVSSSPERLLRIRNGSVSTRPIAGTRPRSGNRMTDAQLSEELIAHPKERAEHVMLIDLERNDLGRICKAGSVEVDEMMVLESYAHVHHIVSNVRGDLRAEVTPGQAIRAVFPGGTITGCPKVRCMQIIAELEQGARGAYTGSFGYLNRDGSLDLNILIRTMIVTGSDVRFRAGAGIVADSEPNAELAETRAKAEGMLRTLKV